MGHMFQFGLPNLWGFMIVFGLLRVLLIVGIVYLIFRVIDKSRSKTVVHSDSSRAIEILKERYASGEISEEEYQRKLKILKE
jgi:putative membrane protein